MQVDNAFIPNAGHAAVLDQRMYLSLADSLEYLCDSIEGKLRFNHQQLGSLIKDLRNGARYSPMLFCRYYEATQAILEDRLELAEQEIDALVNLSRAPSQRQFFGLNHVEYPHHEKYRSLLLEDCDGKIGICEPDPAQIDAFRKRFDAGLALAAQHVPALLGEFNALVREVICIAPDPTKSSQIDGGSHYRLWGALFLNSAFHPNDVAIVEVIAHESAHSLLFGHCIDEALVTNPEDATYASPLRSDLRPMDGIYHATFVSARMHWAMSKLVESPGIDDERRELARKAAALDVENFWQGLDVLHTHGELTETGAYLLSGAEQYMREHGRHSATALA